MKHGSVIVDLAAEQGGNCALTERDKVVERFHTKIVGYTDLASRMADQASELYATVVYNLLEDVWDKEQKRIVIDREDEIHRGICVLDKGVLLWPPPKPKPASHAPRPEKKPNVVVAVPPPHNSSIVTPILGALIVALLCAAGLFAEGEFLQHLTVFLLACVVGWHVVWNVTPALHTPLMSVTNAISGIILVGGVLLLRVGGLQTATMLAAVAILLAMINVAGGFLVTSRMLKMFRRAPSAKEPAHAHGHGGHK
jgi:H+-translocating NAD(P) transhydrogenase subunit alpha